MVKVVRVVNVRLDVDLVDELIKCKKVGDTYSSVVRRLLKGLKT